MKKELLLPLLMLALHMNAQYKIERLYVSATSLSTHQHHSDFDFFPSYDFEIKSNILKKHTVGAGYSFWELNEQNIGQGSPYKVYLNSEYESFYVLYGRYRPVSKRTYWSWQGGPAYYRIMELYNFKKTYVPTSELFGGGYYEWDYDTRFIDDMGILLQTELVCNFGRITGITCGLDFHLSKNFQKINLRFGIPIGYFKRLTKRPNENLEIQPTNQ